MPKEGNFVFVWREHANLIGAELEERDGRYTGFMSQPPLVGEARSAWLRRFAQQGDVDLRHCRRLAAGRGCGRAKRERQEDWQEYWQEQRREQRHAGHLNQRERTHAGCSRKLLL